MSWATPILILLAAYLAVFVETAFELPRHLLGTQVDLLPGLMVYAALSAGPGTIAMLACLGGLCFDAFSANPGGISILPLLVIGWLIQRKKRLLLRDEVFAQVVLGLFASAAMPAMVALSLGGIGETPLVGWVTLWQWTVMTLVGAASTPLWFKLLDALNDAITYPLSKTQAFRSDRQIKRGRT
ncbi:MAG: rod shape-determining protein MreD [Verrucomicrobiota bacterium]